ncbi:MAG: DUF2948 family protein [Dongiaceae bacterium]
MEGAASLKLKAEDAEDVAVIAALVQDAIVQVGDMALLPDQKFILLFSRFCWETGEKPPENIRRYSSLAFHHVKQAHYRGFERERGGDLLELLTLTVEGNDIYIVFAGDAVIKLTVGRIGVFLHDVGEPWPTLFKPCHEAV